MDLTIEAIENDLLLAEQHIGRPGYDLHLTRAKIRATLMGGTTQPLEQTSTFLEPVGGLSVGIPDEKLDIDLIGIPNGTVVLIPEKASDLDRHEVAALILGVPQEQLIVYAQRHVMGIEESLQVQPEAEPDEDDIFADAKKERRK